MPLELIDQPMDRVLIVDKNSPINILSSEEKATPTYIEGLHLWASMNLVLLVDYATNTFTIGKNRWGSDGVKNIPLELLPMFLFHPEETREKELRKML